MLLGQNVNSYGADLIMGENNIHVMRDLDKKYFESNEISWFHNLELVKNYIDEKNERPSSVAKDKDTKILGKWLSHQITNYGKKQKNMKNENIYVAWTEFISDIKYKKFFMSDEELWNEKLNLVKIYIDRENKLF